MLPVDRRAGLVTLHHRKVELQLYEDPPKNRIALDKFEEYAFDRLQLLRNVESLMASSARQDVKIDKICDLVQASQLSADENRDNYSFFTLLLAFCGSEDSRRWLISVETALFKARFIALTSSKRDAFMRQYKFDFQKASPEENEIVASKIRGSSLESTSANWCKVPFEEAIELLGYRRVFLHDGWAFVPLGEEMSLVVQRFRSHVSYLLAKGYRASRIQNVDNRVTRTLKVLRQIDLTPSYKSGKIDGDITPDAIPELSKRSFPLCMQHMYSMLMENSHLKYTGRQQFGLFLKGIGLTVDESMTFWQKAFSRKMDAEKFNKSYSYNVRHSYGKEGKRADYRPYTCSMIISGNPPGHGEAHGCPFRHFDEANLQSALRRRRCDEPTIEDITRNVKNQHFQLACTKYFSWSHNGYEAPNIGNHPNEYFDASYTYLKNVAEKRK